MEVKHTRHDKYQKLIERCTGNQRIFHFAIKVNEKCTLIGYSMFFLLIAYQMYSSEYALCIRVLLTSSLSFVILSVFRHIYNAPRPYEVLDINLNTSMLKAGHSFPSRHTFSLFMIALCWFTSFIPVACFLLVCAVVLASVRVILGFHWPRDAVAAILFALIAAFVGLFLPIYFL